LKCKAEAAGVDHSKGLIGKAKQRYTRIRMDPSNTGNSSMNVSASSSHSVVSSHIAHKNGSNRTSPDHSCLLEQWSDRFHADILLSYGMSQSDLDNVFVAYARLEPSISDRLLIVK
jgi:hypothetical protein